MIFSRHISSAALLGLFYALSACSFEHTSSARKPGNKAPIISVPNQIVEEGGKFTLDLRRYIHDPEGDQFTLTIVSGPGSLSSYGLSRYDYKYQDSPDEDIDHNQYTVQLKAKDSKGGESLGSFVVQQKDVYPVVLQPRAYRLSSGLESMIMDSFGGLGSQLSLAINNRQEPILIYIADNYDLTYAFAIHNIWIRKSIASYQGGCNAILFDKDNVGHLSYTGESVGEDLRYAQFANGLWSRIILDRSPSVGLDNDIALDQNNKVHISYFSWSANRAKYATNAPNGWRVEDLANAAWNQTSIATDLQNKAHLVHVTPNNAVQYLTNMSGPWEGGVIASGTNPVIRMGRQGEMHVVFQRGTLQHGVKQGPTWNLESLPSIGGLGEGNRLSFEIDINNKLHICYLSGGRDSLYLMTNHSSSWREHLLDKGSNWDWENPKIALDQPGNVHIIGARQGKVHYLHFHPSQLH